MNKQLADLHYQREIERNLKSFERAKQYAITNDHLKKFDWLFVSPFFFQGIELEYVYDLSKEADKSLHRGKISRLIERKFYDLNWTASFIEGYCARCSYIQPFLSSIENSLILCFQRDYEGSIKTLLPIIEGIIRQYLVSTHKMSMELIRFSHIKSSFGMMKEDLNSNYKEYLSNLIDENQNKITFSEEEIMNIVKIKKEYFNIWFSFIDDFITNSLYLKLKTDDNFKGLNRHQILHELNSDVEYSFENYIKIYFVLQFLTWIFLQLENKSLLSGMGERRFLDKWAAYHKIIQLSEKLSKEKEILVSKYK